MPQALGGGERDGDAVDVVATLLENSGDVLKSVIH